MNDVKVNQDSVEKFLQDYKNDQTRVMPLINPKNDPETKQQIDNEMNSFAETYTKYKTGEMGYAMMRTLHG
jgi:hypothetical protein